MTPKTHVIQVFKAGQPVGYVDVTGVVPLGKPMTLFTETEALCHAKKYTKKMGKGNYLMAAVRPNTELEEYCCQVIRDFLANPNVQHTTEVNPDQVAGWIRSDYLRVMSTNEREAVEVMLWIEYSTLMAKISKFGT